MIVGCRRRSVPVRSGAAQLPPPNQTRISELIPTGAAADRTRNVVLFRMIFDSFDYCDIAADRTRNVVLLRMILEILGDCIIDLQPVRARRGAHL